MPDGSAAVKVGIYGGSFNPVHYGHVNVARQAVEGLALDRLYVVPANVSPFKTGADEPEDADALSFIDRLESVRSAFASVDRAVVDDREIRRGGVSYAIDTVREIAAECESESSGGELKMYFVIGEDSVEGLPRWKDIEELRKMVEFKVYPRTKESSTEIRGLFAANRVTLNPDGKLAETVRAGVLRKNGFCPCRLQKLPEFFCPCDEFKAQLRDPAYHGFCHCRLYLKP